MSVPWLVTGASGLLGHDLVAQLRRDGEDVLAPGRDALDITDTGAVRRMIAAHRPAVLVNCAAWSAVDDAEAHEREALLINAEGPARLAAACRDTGTRLLHLSTDYVFPGDGTRPYREHDPTGPCNAYGRTKLAGERAVLSTAPEHGHIVRTAWLYGAGRPNFVRTLVRAARTGDTLDVICDQSGQPTWTADLADLLVRLGRAAVAGSLTTRLHHATSAGETTWYGLAREVFRLLGADPRRIRPVPAGALCRPAPRPAYGVLSHEGWAPGPLTPIRDWRAALAAALPDLVRAESTREMST
ncbi:dTDP-4-dehydrorhamnose reductase [Streptomyces caniferus]|uniref:dTDP-4-dehydrorhamnose reductase n=1 Tax=Streptomyces caniferus TaxID=285557 RepID=UPI001359FA56|nr:dTDP-4-dehydrorhamnose reductase [Streptomyces caniferus]